MPPFERLTDEKVCYLTTIGRRSGKRHTIEIWFALHDGTLYLLSGGGDSADWVRLSSWASGALPVAVDL